MWVGLRLLPERVRKPKLWPHKRTEVRGLPGLTSSSLFTFLSVSTCLSTKVYVRVCVTNVWVKQCNCLNRPQLSIMMKPRIIIWDLHTVCVCLFPGYFCRFNLIFIHYYSTNNILCCLQPKYNISDLSVNAVSTPQERGRWR